MPQPRTLIYAALSAVIVLLAIVLFRGCDRPIPAPVSEAKKEVAILKRNKDSIHQVVITKEIERIKYVDRWHTVRRDSLIPCEIKLIVCDTLVLADSSLIGKLNAQARIDSMIIRNQDRIIAGDSLTIIGLTKKVKRSQFWTKVLGLVTIGSLGYAAGR